ncbi:MAG: M20/M25/M40 family metallo-hydrolase [Hyphomonadaceae bacterium]
MTRQAILALSLMGYAFAMSGCAIAEQAFTQQTADATPADASAKLEAAFADIVEMDARNIERLIAITEIPAPTFSEEVRAADFARRLEAIGGVSVEIDEVGNVLARRKGSGNGRTLALVAHLDTVFPAETDVTVRQEGNVYFAPGIGDDARGLVVLLSLLEVMNKNDMATDDDILFIGSVGEEGLGDLRGVRHIFREDGPKIDNFIAIDGGTADRVVTEGVGSNRYRITYEGPGGHSYGAFGRAHPHQALAQAIINFTEAATPITQSGPKATFSVGRIGGGTSINSIPFKSWMEVDMRSEDKDKLAELDVVFRASIQEALDTENDRRSRDEAITINVDQVGQRPVGRTDLESSLVQNTKTAIESMGLTPQFLSSSTDSNMPMSLGIPAITMGKGGIGRNAHSPDESWENKDPHIAIQTLLLVVAAEANLQ